MKIKNSNTQQRLLYLMQERNLKQKDILEATELLCKQYNVKFNKSDISQYVSGKTEPNQDKLYILSEALKVNVVWLMGYDVPMDEKSATLGNYNEWSTKHELSLEIEKHYGKQTVKLVNEYQKLDEIDQSKILERIDVLLEDEKYSIKKESKHA